MVNKNEKSKQGDIMTKEQWIRQKLENVLIEMGVEFPKNALPKVLWRLYFQNQENGANPSRGNGKRSEDIYDRGRRGSGNFNG